MHKKPPFRTVLGMISLGLIYALLAGIFTLQHVYIIISIYGILGGLGFVLWARFKGIET